MKKQDRTAGTPFKIQARPRSERTYRPTGDLTHRKAHQIRTPKHEREDFVGDPLTSTDFSTTSLPPGVALAGPSSDGEADDSQLTLLFPQVDVDVDDEELDGDEASLAREYFDFIFFNFNLGRIDLIIPGGFSKSGLLSNSSSTSSLSHEGGGARGTRIGLSSGSGCFGVPGSTSQWKGTAPAVTE